MEHKDDLELRDLGQFYGTEHYYKGFLNTTLTEGIAYIINNGYSWFVTDTISIIKLHPRVKGEEFVAIDLKIEGKEAQMIITDGNNNILYKQKYGYTDAKREITLYFVNDVLMLSGEY